MPLFKYMLSPPAP